MYRITLLFPNQMETRVFSTKTGKEEKEEEEEEEIPLEITMEKRDGRIYVNNEHLKVLNKSRFEQEDRERVQHLIDEGESREDAFFLVGINRSYPEYLRDFLDPIIYDILDEIALRFWKGIPVNGEEEIIIDDHTIRRGDIVFHLPSTGTEYSQTNVKDMVDELIA